MARRYQGLTLYVRDPDTRTFKALNKKELRYFPRDYKTGKGQIRVETNEVRQARAVDKSGITVDPRKTYWEGYVDINGLENIG